MKTFAKSKIIYMDYHATTPVDPRVLRAMLPFFVHRFANAASFTHTLGRDAAERAESARAEVAGLIGADAREIVFTSGGTEANNLAVKGVAEALRGKGDHLITAATEHKSVLDPVKRLSMSGFRVTILKVNGVGQIDLEELRAALTPKTVLVSVMLANNEIGTIAPLKEIVSLSHAAGALVHSDAVQAAGKIPIDVRSLGVDLLSLSAHKLYGPKGVGALYIRKAGLRQKASADLPARVPLLPLFDGGAQETGMRSGTLNVPGIVGFGAACRVAKKGMKAEARRLSRLRDALEKGILEAVPGARVNGDRNHRLPNNLNVSFPGFEARALLEHLPNLALSSGSACLSSSVEPSYVLKALSVPQPLRAGSLRFGLGRFNTERDIHQALKQVCQAVQGTQSK